MFNLLLGLPIFKSFKFWFILACILFILAFYFLFKENIKLHQELKTEQYHKELIIDAYNEAIPIIKDTATAEATNQAKKEMIDTKTQKLNTKIKEKPKYEIKDNNCDSVVATFL